MPSFAVKSYFCIYVGTTQPVILPVTPQHGTSTFFMCSIGYDPYGDSIQNITLSISSTKEPKNDKNAAFLTFFQNYKNEITMKMVESKNDIKL